MKIFKRISEILMCIMILLFTETLVSCEEIEGKPWERPNDMSPYIPDHSILLIGSWSVSGNIANFNLEPSIFADFDYWQLKIKSIDYYIDETLIKTDTKEPYTFIYTTPNLSEGQHQFIAKVTIEDLINHKEIVILSSKKFKVDSYSDSDLSNGITYNASWSQSGNNVYLNIDNVDILKSLASNGWTLISVSFYIDAELIDTVYKEPFGIEYTAKNLSQGKHHFIIKGKVINTSINQEQEISREIEIDIP